MRTNKLIVILRSCAIVFVVYVMLASAWNSITMSSMWSPLEMLISAVLTVLLFGNFGWLFVKAGMALTYGRDPEYRAYRNSGGDPYFDSLPWPINPDSQMTRSTGMQEPHTSFMPPADWRLRPRDRCQQSVVLMDQAAVRF